MHLVNVNADLNSQTPALQLCLAQQYVTHNHESVDGTFIASTTLACRCKHARLSIGSSRACRSLSTVLVVSALSKVVTCSRGVLIDGTNGAFIATACHLECEEARGHGARNLSR